MSQSKPWTLEDIRDYALSLPECGEFPHFDKSSFRVKKKIAFTLNEKEDRICVKLNRIDQSTFHSIDANHIHPVPNAYGKQGWTLVYFSKLHPELVKDLINSAYIEVAPKKLGDSLRPKLEE